MTVVMEAVVMEAVVTEEWRTIPGYEQRYEVSDQGRVRTLGRPSGQHGGSPGQRVLKTYPHVKGNYPMVNLYVDKRRRVRPIHALVALAFLGPPPEGKQVRHLDGDEQNNTPSNLAYGTAGENQDDQVRHGRHANANKTECPQGHEYDEGNTRMYQGRRYCRRCDGWSGR